jgi:transposase-like protein
MNPSTEETTSIYTAILEEASKRKLGARVGENESYMHRTWKMNLYTSLRRNGDSNFPLHVVEDLTKGISNKSLPI